MAIEYLKEDVTIKSLLNSSIRKIGVSMKDLKWENGRIFVDDDKELISVNGNWVRKGKRVYLITPDKFYFQEMSFPHDSTKLKRLYNKVENKAIVTGRVDSVKDKVLQSLDKLGLEYPKHGLHCFPTNKQTSDRVAQWKAKTIVELLKETGFERAFFYDDRAKWVNKVTAAVKKELPHIDWNPVKYDYKKTEILERYICEKGSDGYEPLTWEDYRTAAYDQQGQEYPLYTFTNKEISILVELGASRSTVCKKTYIMDNLNIKKRSDEWYFIESYGDAFTFFKCDQFDGLLNCLKNEFNIR